MIVSTTYFVLTIRVATTRVVATNSQEEIINSLVLLDAQPT